MNAELAPASQRRFSVIPGGGSASIQAQSQTEDYERTLHGGGEPPDNGPMEARVIKLEDFAQDTRERLARIETKLDAFASKSDLSDMKSDIIKWVVGTAVGLGVAAITVMTFVLNNATPKPAQQAAPPAIIINVPSQPPSK